MAARPRVVIRNGAPGGEDALTLIRQLDEDLCRRYPEMPAQKIHGLQPSDLADPNFMFLIARAAGRPVGCGALRALEPGIAEIKRMFVAADWRRQGIARRILSRLESSALAAGRTVVRLETGRGQPEAIHLYRSAGYREIPRFGTYASNSFSVCFEKTLA
jgi:ribosomal protein S18 acetylase RimI-like enzyme